jgi:dynein heavy chain 1
MVWFSEDVLSLDMIFEHFLTRLRNISIDEGEEEVRGRIQIGKRAGRSSTSKDDTVSPTLQVMRGFYKCTCTCMYVHCT